MTSLSFNLPRPGLALGCYPERQTPRPDRLEAFFSRVTAPVISRWESRASHLECVISDINKTGLSFTDLPDDALLKVVAELQVQLAGTEWNQDIAIRAFALVREMSERTIGMRHYESQLLAGWVMYQGKFAEMQTGEGKTLAATLPAATAALAGVPVHVITTNDYLAIRDATQMRPLYEALGLSVGVVSENMDFKARQFAYSCNITYCTNKQIAFDYLRDQVERGSAKSKLHLGLEKIYDDPSRQTKLMLRGLCFAIVDEADSVLIDEARTPLVLSRAVNGDETLHASYRHALSLAEDLTPEEDFCLHLNQRQAFLTSSGRARLASSIARLYPDSNASRQTQELVQQALSARHLFLRDRDYIVNDGKVQIVDANTGRVMADRSWERGLQQMIETKEHCRLSGNKETLARISYQRFFRRYLKISGMTGTAREVARELGQVYDASVVHIPPQRKSQRAATPECVYAYSNDASAAVVACARKQVKQGRPVLIGTRSVLKSEQLAQLLAKAGLEAQVLNARQDADEASIIEQAGKARRITVATNMAGRGTDIHLGPGVHEAGGLHVIVTERNDAARVDRQLYGRCARQGDPGSYQVIASLEDDIPTLFYSASMRNLLTKLGRGTQHKLPDWLGGMILNLAQRQIECRLERARRQVEREDERLNTMLSFTGSSE